MDSTTQSYGVCYFRECNSRICRRVILPEMDINRASDDFFDEDVYRLSSPSDLRPTATHCTSLFAIVTERALSELGDQTLQYAAVDPQGVLFESVAYQLPSCDLDLRRKLGLVLVYLIDALLVDTELKDHMTPSFQSFCQLKRRVMSEQRQSDDVLADEVEDAMSHKLELDSTCKTFADSVLDVSETYAEFVLQTMDGGTVETYNAATNTEIFQNYVRFMQKAVEVGLKTDRDLRQALRSAAVVNAVHAGIPMTSRQRNAIQTASQASPKLV